MGQIFTPNAKLKRLARRSIGEIATTLTTQCVGSSRLVIPMPDAMRAGGLDIIEEQETASRERGDGDRHGASRGDRA